jgi:hypothetical protein
MIRYKDYSKVSVDEIPSEARYLDDEEDIFTKSSLINTRMTRRVENSSANTPLEDVIVYL